MKLFYTYQLTSQVNKDAGVWELAAEHARKALRAMVEEKDLHLVEMKEPELIQILVFTRSGSRWVEPGARVNPKDIAIYKYAVVCKVAEKMELPEIKVEFKG